MKGKYINQGFTAITLLCIKHAKPEWPFASDLAVEPCFKNPNEDRK